MELTWKDKINSIIEPYHEPNKNPKNGAEIPVGSHKQKTIYYILDLWKYKWTQRISHGIWLGKVGMDWLASLKSW